MLSSQMRKHKQKVPPRHARGPRRAKASIYSSPIQVQERNQARIPTPPLDYEDPIASTKKVPVCHKVMEVLREDVLREIATHPLQRPTLDRLATALLNQDSLLKLHQAHSSSQYDLTRPVAAISSILANLSFGEKENSLRTVLQKLERDPKSWRKSIVTWDEAKKFLEDYIEFQDSVPKMSESRKNMSLSDFERLLLRRNKASNERRIRFINSRPLFLQIAFTRPPPVEAAVTEKEAISLEKEDRLLDQQVDDAREATERKTRAVSELERRMRAEEEERSREEEAQQLAASLLRELTEEERRIVDGAMYGIGPKDEILAQVGTDTLQRGSMQRLQSGHWLNDEVIHYFYVMLATRDEALVKQDPSRKRSHFFKSFFMTKLLNEGNADPNLDGKYLYKNVKRWSKKVPGKDIFALDKIFFPVNQNNAHWVCVCVFMTEKRIQMYDSMGSEEDFHIQCIFQYLQDEHMDKKKCPLPDVDEWQLVTTQADCPQQRNGFDCGVFTCMFADFLSQNRPLVFKQDHVTQCRERICLSIMNGVALS